nr:type IV pilin protein [Thiocystis minor]
MITVAIVGILAAIAYPSYQDSVRKSWRANGASCLMELAQRMERRYTGTSSYAGGVPASECNDANSDMVNNRYTFAFATTPALTATTFQLQAQPVDPGPQADDSCGTLTIDQTGLKGSAGTVSDCWRR